MTAKFFRNLRKDYQDIFRRLSSEPAGAWPAWSRRIDFAR